MYPFVIKVKFNDDSYSHIETENVIIYADSYKDAAGWVENYYSQTLISFEIQIIGDGPLILSDKVINQIKTEMEAD